MIINGEKMTLVDVRRADEFESGYIEGAVNIPLEELMTSLDQLASNEKIVIYCKSGTRGQIATNILLMLGYEDVLNMSGGIMGWQAAELPLLVLHQISKKNLLPLLKITVPIKPTAQ